MYLFTRWQTVKFMFLNTAADIQWVIFVEAHGQKEQNQNIISTIRFHCAFFIIFIPIVCSIFILIELLTWTESQY